MAPTAKNRLFIICFLSIVFSSTQALCVPRSSSHLSRSPASQPASASPPDTNAPTWAMGTYPPIYYPPNGQPVASPSPQPDSSLPPKSASSPDTNAPPVFGNRKNPFPPIYYPPNGEPVASPGPQPASSLSPTSQPDQAPTPSPVTGNMDPSSHIYSPSNGQPSQSPEEASSSSTKSELLVDNDIPAPSSRVSSQSSKFASTTDSPALKKICDATDYPAICLDSITPFRMAGKVDPLSVLEMAIKACTAHAKQAVTAATKFSTPLDVEYDSDSGMQTCKDSYNDALDSFQKALDAISTKDIGTINSMLSSAITASSDCADATAGELSPVATFNDKLKKMASNSLAIVTQIN